MKIRTGFIAAAAVAALFPLSGSAKEVGLTLVFGQDVEIASNKDVSVRVACIEDLIGGSDEVSVYATTTAAEAVLEGDDTYSGDGDYLTPLTPPDESVLMRESDDNGIQSFDNDASEGWVMSLETFRGLRVIGDNAVLGVNVNEEIDCMVNFEMEKLGKFKAAKSPKAPKEMLK